MSVDHPFWQLLRRLHEVGIRYRGCGHRTLAEVTPRPVSARARKNTLAAVERATAWCPTRLVPFLALVHHRAVFNGTAPGASAVSSSASYPASVRSARSCGTSEHHILSASRAALRPAVSVLFPYIDPIPTLTTISATTRALSRTTAATGLECAFESPPYTPSTG